jgi:Na+/glutamate symporter
MRLISAILFAVIFGFAGAYFAGPVGDWLLLQNSIETFRPTFESPDQAAYFDLVVRLVITLLFAFVGMIFGIVIGGRLQRRLIRQED